MPRYRFGDFVLSPRRRVLLRDGREHPLIPRYFDLLVYLVERRSEAVHRRDIFDAVWTDVIVSDSALSQAIRTIRRALDDDPREPRFVRTVSRHGYQFVCPDVIEEDDRDLPSAIASAEVAPGGPPADDDGLATLLRQIAGPQRDPAAQEDQREAAERLHAFGTARALQRLPAGDTAYARALLRDTRWDVPGAGAVPIVGRPDATSVIAHLVRLRLSRASALVASRWASASIGAAIAGAAAGAAGGLLLMLPADSTSPAPAIVVLAVLGAGIGAAAGAGVGAGLATAEAVIRSRRLLALLLGGATGGALVGVAVQLLVQWSLRMLVGVDAPVGGGVEGLVIGAAVGLGYGAATGRATGGLASPSGAARTRVVLITGIASALAALGLSIAGRPLAGGTINVVAQASRGAQVALAPLGTLIGEPGFGPLTAGLIATGEGAFFGAGLALGLTRRPRISRTSQGSLTAR